MAALDNEKDTIRLSLELTLETNAVLEGIADKIGATKSEVLRKGIALIEVALEAKAKGHRLGVLDKKDRLVTRIVGI